MSQRPVLKCTTFRDGCQGRYVEEPDLKDALKAIEAIDQLGIAYHEVGFADSNQLVQSRIIEACRLNLRGKVAAFGRTHEKEVEAIVRLPVPVAVLVGKTRLSDCPLISRTAEQNLSAISQMVGDLCSASKEVIYDAEHCFQALFEDDRSYALETLQAANQAGASWLVLCDTNGKMTPEKIREGIAMVKKVIPLAKLGIHTHNDRGRAVVNAEAAWEAGVTLIEGTIGGFGERCGNLDLCTLIPNLVVDYGVDTISPEQLRRLTDIYLMACDALNMPPQHNQPWVGKSAFYSEAGMHINAELKKPGNYCHSDPQAVGNNFEVGVTGQSGKSNVLLKARQLGLEISAAELDQVMKAYIDLVNSGMDFGLAEASFHLFLLRQLGRLPEFFQFESFWISIDKQAGSEVQTEAGLRVLVDGKKKLHNADGDGPVNALDEVFRRTFKRRYPQILRVKLTDFKVKTVDPFRGTAAKVRVRIWWSDGTKEWSTVGVHENLIEASWEALLDGYLYELVVNGSAN